MATTSATIEQAQAYLQDQGYQTPDAGEIQGAMSYLNANPSVLSTYASSSTGSSGASGSNGTTAGGSIAYSPNWSAYGVTQDTWSKMNALQQAQVSIVMNQALTGYAQNASSLSVHDALSAAQNDPSIVSKYADALSMDSADFQQSLSQLQQSTSTTAQSNQQQFEQDRKNLAKQEAAAGMAYSGFRNEAEQNLQTSEAGIVTSSNSQTQQQLNQLRQNFEAKYGTAATPQAGINFTDPLNGGNTSISGQLQTPGAMTNITGNTVGTQGAIGGVIGTQNVAKSQDTTSLALQNIQASTPVPVTAVSQ